MLVCGARVVNARLSVIDPQRRASPPEEKASVSFVDGTIKALRTRITRILDLRWQSVRNKSIVARNG